MDEACSNVRVQLDSAPEDIDHMQRQRMRLQVEGAGVHVCSSIVGRGKQRLGGSREWPRGAACTAGTKLYMLAVEALEGVLQTQVVEHGM